MEANASMRESVQLCIQCSICVDSLSSFHQLVANSFGKMGENEAHRNI